MAQCWAKLTARHTSQEFVAFLAQLVADQPRGKEIHFIADNLSAHKTQRVGQFLAAHPRVHYTPTYSSWLNQVENWFEPLQLFVPPSDVKGGIENLLKERSARHG